MNHAVKNTLAGRKARPALSVIFKPKVILALVLIGIFSFTALIALSGYAGDLRKDVSGKATATSRSAIGYAAFVQLLKDMDYTVSVEANLATSASQWRNPLRIYTLVGPNQSQTLKDIPQDEAKLVVLPKWNTRRQISKAGWVDKAPRQQTLNAERLSKLLGNADIDLEIKQAMADRDGAEYNLNFARLHSSVLNRDDDFDEAEQDEDLPYNYDIHTIDSPVDRLQSFVLKSAVDRPDVILLADEQPVLIRLAGTQTYILSEPDLLNTHGIAPRSRAQFAVNILDVIAEYEDLTLRAVDFDLSIHGLGGGRNIIKLMTQPPFLAATLCLLAAGGIIAWQAFSRFGDPLRLEPDFAQGPVSLAKSAAEFMAVSNRLQHMAPDYAKLTRQQVVRDMGLIGQSQDHITRAIKTRETQRDISPKFDELTADNAPNKSTNLMQHARAMTRWKKEMMS